MEKVTCEVIQDLLVLYEDDVCSEQSRKIVEEHIKDCEVCQTVYEKMYGGVPQISVEGEKGASILQKVQNKIMFRQVLAIALILIILLGGYAFWSDKVFWVSTDDMQVSEIYELKNGNIYYQVKAAVPCDTTVVEESAPAYYLQNSETDVAVRMGLTMPGKVGLGYWEYKGMGGVIATTEEIDSGQGTKSRRTCDELYLQGDRKSDKKVIWKKGEKLEAAPNSVEQKVEEHMAELQWVHNPLSISGFSWQEDVEIRKQEWYMN